MKSIYIVDHFVPWPQSEYGGIWTLVAETDEQCYDMIVEDDEDLNTPYYGKLRENIMKATKYPLVGDPEPKIVDTFLT